MLSLEPSGRVLSMLGFPEGVKSHQGHPAMSSCPWDHQPLSQPLPGRTVFYIYSTLFPHQATHAALRQGPTLFPGAHFHPKRTQGSKHALEFPRVLEDVFPGNRGFVLPQRHFWCFSEGLSWIL